MGLSVFPAAAGGGLTPRRITLTSGTSWTVPAGVTFVNVTLYGGGSGGSYGGNSFPGLSGLPGEVISSTLSTTPGASITYAIGAGGAGGTGNLTTAGGTTTFTGATSATGGNALPNNGNGGAGKTSEQNNGGGPSQGNTGGTGGTGGPGKIEIEYWV
jgi:hypothetical protein